MTRSKALQVESPIGRQETDSAGSPVGVVRMDTEKSYANIGHLLQGYLKSSFFNRITLLRLSNPLLNPKGHDLLKEFFYGPACLAAWQMSQAGMEMPDPFQPDLTLGKGKWPSFQVASYFFAGSFDMDLPLRSAE